MIHKNDIIIINRGALAQAAKALEGQKAFHALLLLHCLDQVDDIYRKLRLAFEEESTNIAHTTFLQLYLTEQEWTALLKQHLKACKINPKSLL